MLWNSKFTVGILIILPWIQTISDGELKRTSTVSAANKVGRSQEFDANLFYQKLAVIIKNPLKRIIIYSFSLWSYIVESIFLHVFKILASISIQLLFFVVFCCFFCCFLLFFAFSPLAFQPFGPDRQLAVRCHCAAGSKMRTRIAPTARTVGRPLAEV